MTKSIINIENVSVFFKQRKSFFRHQLHYALSDINFDVYEGETLGIIGRNGCGKSTLLKIIAGIIEPDSGSVAFDNINISLLTLSAGFDEELTGRDNAIVSSMLLGYSKLEAIQNVDAINEFAELHNSFNEPVKTYSSGMRARLGFAVATTMQTDVLLVDEILGVGDTSFRKKAEKVILDKMQSDQTVIFVSHNAAQVNRLCDRVIWLEGGEIEGIGDTEVVLKDYENLLINKEV